MRAVILLMLVAGYAISHTIGQIKTHKCVHDTKFKDMELKEMPEITTHEIARLLQALTIDPNAGLTGKTTTGGTGTSGSASTARPVVDGWHQMRIFVDYSYGQSFVQTNPSINSKYQMSIRLVESVRNYFTKTLVVNFTPTMKFPGGTCYNNKIAAYEKPVDLFITLSPENDPSTDYFAAATPCYVSSRDSRPTVGAYILNLAFLEIAPLNEYLYFSTFAHEFTHILGFSDNLFPKYVRPGTSTPRTDVTTKLTIGTEQFSAISMPEVVNFARSYFSCNSITGIPLENNGGDGSAGSHWEKTFLPQEYMNPTVENPGILSEFTMTLLRATGWYQIGPNAAQRYDWGQNAGCGIFKICPQSSSGYCTAAQVSQPICSSEWISKVKFD